MLGQVLYIQNQILGAEKPAQPTVLVGAATGNEGVKIHRSFLLATSLSTQSSHTCCLHRPEEELQRQGKLSSPSPSVPVPQTVEGRLLDTPRDNFPQQSAKSLGRLPLFRAALDQGESEIYRQ